MKGVGGTHIIVSVKAEKALHKIFSTVLGISAKAISQEKKQQIFKLNMKNEDFAVLRWYDLICKQP